MATNIAINLWDIISACFFIVTAILGFLIKNTLSDWSSRLKMVEDDIHEIKEELPHQYVQKEDYREDVQEIKININKIMDMLISGMHKE